MALAFYECTTFTHNPLRDVAVDQAYPVQNGLKVALADALVDRRAVAHGHVVAVGTVSTRAVASMSGSTGSTMGCNVREDSTISRIGAAADRVALREAGRKSGTGRRRW